MTMTTTKWFASVNDGPVPLLLPSLLLPTLAVKSGQGLSLSQ
jgi:hypothetical protein